VSRRFGAEDEQCSVDGGVDKLQTGTLPILAERGAESQNQDGKRCCYQGEACREAKQDEQAETGLHPWQHQTKGHHRPGGQRGGVEDANERCGEGMRAGEQPAYAMNARFTPMMPRSSA
jgi:hypothetical protein